MQTTNLTLSVSELNTLVRSKLESTFGMMMVKGEISNYVLASSGHSYFSLKDEKAQVKCAFFAANQRQNTLAKLQNGQKIIAYAKVSLYEPRGDYQLIISKIEDDGIGLLYQQFIELKNRLAQEGLFDQVHKKPVPKYPKHLAIITSPVGAALHDIKTTLVRRFPLLTYTLYPSEVQGANAASQLTYAIEKVISDKLADCIILARGGGSLEDLFAFNDEMLARTIYGSPIPIITGIGHETDFTIADFVADLRAATPTAAAEKASPNQFECFAYLTQVQGRISAEMKQQLLRLKQKLLFVTKRFDNPEKILFNPWQRLDFLHRNLINFSSMMIKKNMHQYQTLEAKLLYLNPKQQINIKLSKLEHLQHQLQLKIQQQLELKSLKLKNLNQSLNTLGPQATLDRGYAIALQKEQVLLDANDAMLFQDIEVILAKGRIKANIFEKKT
ncbi:MAG: exodeoxyribonuclease VII large subunit [Gammaproteobacteria bacterium]|nr:exodeoxyribonuclease VII large subunit [Gammaproteobacteria bacterium]